MRYGSRGRGAQSLSPLVHVVAGVLTNARGQVLLTRRPDHAHQGGLWELPGGKLQPGEPGRQGLERELREELGVGIQAMEPLIRVVHDYGDRRVRLEVWRVTAYTGRPEGLEGQPLAWVAVDDLARTPLPAADRPVVNALRLPTRYLITPESAGDRDAFLGALERALEGGCRLVQLRVRGLAPAAYRSLARAVAGRCHAFGGRLLLNADPAMVAATGADGVHLTAARLMAADARPLGHDAWVAASCHDGRELAQATAIGVDFAVLGPVLPTVSHPEQAGLGWDGFQALVDEAACPVFALGGMTPADVPEARIRGGQGVAGIRSMWPVED